MFQLFTDETLEVIKFAQKEANKRGDSFLGSEHLLLGLIKKGGGITKEVLTLFKIDFQTVIDAIENINNQSNIEKEPKLFERRYCFSHETSSILYIAEDEALYFGHKHIGPEHLLLGLAIELSGIAIRVFETLEVDVFVLREKIIELTSDNEIPRRERFQLLETIYKKIDGCKKDFPEDVPPNIEDWFKEEKSDPKLEDQFVNFLKSVGKLDPDYELNNSLGRIIDDFNSLIKVEPSNADAFFMRGKSKNDLGIHKEALEDLDKAIDLNPKDPEYYSVRSEVKCNLDKYQEALEDHDKAIDLNPKDPEYYYERSIVKCNLDKDQEALEDLDKAIDLNPNISKFYSERGLLKFNLGNFEESILDCEKAICLDPEDLNSFLIKGLFKYHLKDFYGSISDLINYEKKDPKNFTCLMYLGMCKFDLKDFCNAQKEFNKVLEIIENKEALRYRGICNLELGKKELAKEDFANAIGLGDIESEKLLSELN